MSFLSWGASMLVMLTLLSKSLEFHRATLCRQETWRGALILRTGALLSKAPTQDKLYISKCRKLISRKETIVSWGRNTNLELSLKGKL